MLNRFACYLSLTLVLALVTFGCDVQFKNTPSDDVVVKGLNITGQYKVDQRTPKGPFKGKVSIKISNDDKFPYLIEYDMKGPPKDQLLCQTYRFGESNIAFLKYKKSGPAKDFFAFKLEISDDQILAKPLERAFFTKHSDELALAVGADNALVSSSESRELDRFFKKHHITQSLFSDEKTLILTRFEKGNVGK